MLLKASVPVPRLWPDATLACVANGPSLCQEDLTLLRERAIPILAVNSAIFHAPWAPVLYAPDAKWWGWHGAAAAALPAMGYTLSPEVAAQYPHVACLDFAHEPGISWDRGRIHTNGHGGAQAINLAAHFGPRRIVLLGYDMRPAADGRHHAGAEHPDGSHVRYEQWLSVYAELRRALMAQRIMLLNASRATAIREVPHVTLRQALRPPPTLPLALEEQTA